MTAGRATREQEVPPKASVLVESLRDIGYSLHTAVSDVIDNSLTAGALKIELHAETHAEVPAIGILDDGTGMTEAELLEAMRPGSRSPLEGRTATDLGRFGLGLKTASFSQCRRLTVVTRRAGVTSCAVWDLDTVAARDRWIVELPGSVETIPWCDCLAADGTLVVWQKLDRLVGPDGREDRRDLVRQLAETARHVEFVFHRFLSGREDKEGRVAISLNGRELRPFDPFHSHHQATQHHQEEPFVLAGKEIRIQPVTLPHHDKVSKDDWTRYGGPEGYVKNQGFYLYRNRRLIVHGTWFGLARQLELTKLCRVRIDMPSSLDAEWKIDVKKAWAQPPPPVRERLCRIIERIGVPSRRTYTIRGSRLAGDSLLPYGRGCRTRTESRTGSTPSIRSSLHSRVVSIRKRLTSSGDSSGSSFPLCPSKHCTRMSAEAPSPWYPRRWRPRTSRRSWKRLGAFSRNAGCRGLRRRLGCTRLIRSGYTGRR